VINSISLAEAQLGSARKCAHCGMANKKSNSSNVFFCTSCSTMNCFLCGHSISSLDHFNKPNILGELCLRNSPMANLEGLTKPPHENFVYSFNGTSYSIKLTTKKALNTIESKKLKNECCCENEEDYDEDYEDEDYNDEYDLEEENQLNKELEKKLNKKDSWW